jgi:hypothetical protein
LVETRRRRVARSRRTYSLAVSPYAAEPFGNTGVTAVAFRDPESTQSFPGTLGPYAIPVGETFAFFEGSDYPVFWGEVRRVTSDRGAIF